MAYHRRFLPCTISISSAVVFVTLMIATAPSISTTSASPLDDRFLISMERSMSLDWLAPFVDQAIIPSERQPINRPHDAHAAAYLRANQPLAAWRTAADVTFAFVDQHLRV